MPQELEGKTILVVDDDPDILTAVTAGLKDSGATVHTASDGNTAVSQVEKLRPHLVILDIMLPQKSGFLVLEQVRQKVPRDQLPKIVMITGNAGQRHRQYAQALGVNEYLQKPFRMDRLIEITHKLLLG
ncbi:MAG: response regulator [Planctomycetota bacterium]